MHDNLFGFKYSTSEKATWSITLDGRYLNSVKKHLVSEGVPENGVQSIVINACRILRHCPNPISKESFQKTGIVIGKVQSGKTSNFLSLTALAFDNDYKIVVILGGTKKPLVKQNSDRVFEYFYEMKSEVYILDTNRHRDLLREDKISQFIRTGKKVIIVSLKSPAQISNLNKSLFKNSILSEEPILVIDDEGDEASLNTLIHKGNKSSTYKEIEALKLNLKRHTYISVTATPQANILIDAIDVLSPDFGVLVDPGSGYCGLDAFHGEDKIHIVKIPESESDILKDLGVPETLKAALMMFFVGCALRKQRGMTSDDKFSMLIHPSHKKIDHRSVNSKIETLLTLWKKTSQNKSDISYSVLKKELMTAHSRYISDGISAPSFEGIENDCILAINQCGLHIINGDSVTNDADQFYEFNIYVGGNMLGRGLTLSGLAITYIVRTTVGKSNVDTVEQRARWFGYKSKYLDLCRVYAPEKILREFVEIRDHEQDLWEMIRLGNLQGSRFKDLARIFVLSDNMKMTRTNVAKTQDYAFPFWNFQRHFQSNSDYILNNKTIIDSYKNGHSAELKELGFGKARPHKVLYNQMFLEVKEQIIDKFVFPEGSHLNRALVNKIFLLLRNLKIDSVIDVIWMRDGQASEHPVNDGIISEYMSGRRPADYEKKATYLGDRYMLEKNNVMQLQIHEILDTESKITSYTLALYIPKDYISRITNLVMRR